jgi:hypothetical protein
MGWYDERECVCEDTFWRGVRDQLRRGSSMHALPERRREIGRDIGTSLSVLTFVQENGGHRRPSEQRSNGKGVCSV